MFFSLHPASGFQHLGLPQPPPSVSWIKSSGSHWPCWNNHLKLQQNSSDTDRAHPSMNQSIEMKPTIRTGSVDMSFYSPSLYQSGNSPPPNTHTTTTFPSVTHLIHTNDSTPTGCWHLVYDKRHVIVDISGIFGGGRTHVYI